ncbi:MULTISPECIES: hypothetical protein [Methylorubrum]|jgi:hypothetical protein|uniref:Uncharacterized protein n=3 Tax=Methylorubrum extorquens TaxID=408 RepID=C5ATV7_METEA|nr:MULTISPECIES: hypothetical protein [Methylorubrum]KQO87186.1 hypothetical protein ASF36_07355 [Methylobacterium sp. Leaf90]KQP86206.1 hypothetical protein ASF55_13415 [Methylobacterium sp. Leaf119]MBA9067318.1 hypothetical protein [Methylobacterium sp. RAS18]MDF9862883.1 hypothetical protein [Methylorubrum pseudosasae]MDH6636493.1 hypothetical protein [Methylobacterium sp. SuP10 SLI 274]
MKAIYAVAAVGLGLMGSIASVSAQPYGSRDYGYEERGRGYGGRDYDDEDRGRGYGGRGYGRRDYGFDEREYLRCNPDVLRAVRRGQMESGAAHYQTFGRRERRRLSC